MRQLQMHGPFTFNKPAQAALPCHQRLRGWLRNADCSAHAPHTKPPHAGRTCWKQDSISSLKEVHDKPGAHTTLEAKPRRLH